MQQYGYSDNKSKVLKRLSRAEGQVRGVANMVEADKYCIDILTQISAAQAALDKVAVELLRDHARHCMSASSNPDERTKKADELALAVNRMLKA